VSEPLLKNRAVLSGTCKTCNSPIFIESVVWAYDSEAFGYDFAEMFIGTNCNVCGTAERSHRVFLPGMQRLNYEALFNIAQESAQKEMDRAKREYFTDIKE
jgi:hypothetical protein